MSVKDIEQDNGRRDAVKGQEGSGQQSDGSIASSDEMLSTPAVARECGVTRGAAWLWVTSGRLKARQVAGRLLVARADLDAFKASRERESSMQPVTPMQFGGMSREVRNDLTKGLLGFGFPTVASALRTLTVLVVRDPTFADAFRAALLRREKRRGVGRPRAEL